MIFLSEYHSSSCASGATALPSLLKCSPCLPGTSFLANRKVYKNHIIINIEESLGLMKAALPAMVVFSMLSAFGKQARPTSAQLIFRAHQLIQ